LDEEIKMNRIHIVTLSTVLTITMTISAITSGAQTATASNSSAASNNKSEIVELNIAVPQERIAIGATPWVYLTVKNLSGEEINYPRDRVYVEGENGEPPTTLLQRQLTHRLKPGEPSILGGGFEPTIEPGNSFTRKYDLSQLYDLSKPGKYTVFIEVSDDVHSNRGKGKWVRSSTATFEIQPSSQ
jgi:hypothetical protein